MHMQRQTSMTAETAPSNQCLFSAVDSMGNAGAGKGSKSKTGSGIKNKDTDKPKRPLSSYNLFFQAERAKILETTPSKYEGNKPRRSHGKIGFASLARTIAGKWNNIDPETRKHFDQLAAKDKERYKREMEVWKAKESMKKSNEPLPMSAAADYMGCGGMAASPGFNAHSIVKCNLMAQQQQAGPMRMPLNKFRPLSQPSMGNVQRLMPPNFFSNNMNGQGNTMRGGSASQVVGQALALLEDDMPSFQPSNNRSIDDAFTMENAFGEPENAFTDSPDISDLASKLDDDCLGLLSGLL